MEVDYFLPLREPTVVKSCKKATPMLIFFHSLFFECMKKNNTDASILHDLTTIGFTEQQK